MKFLSLMVVASLLSPTVFACSEDGKSGFLPENDLSIPVGDKNAGGLTEEQFNAVIDKYETIYAPIISGMGGTLKVNRKWTDATVNASAQRSGSTWTVNMFGGLARHTTITEDGFALVVCHELGHHLGGAPKIKGFLGMNNWASNEGQSDYFATLKCLRKGFLSDNNAEVVSRMAVPTLLSEKCAAQFADEAEKNICIRGGMAGVSVAGLFASMRNQPEGKFETPDQNVVSRTNDAHPAHQCRLDTYFQGALCDKSFNEDVDQKDEVTGTCHGSTSHATGLRPLCWFKPSVQ
jgi:hypothetical protein